MWTVNKFSLVFNVKSSNTVYIRQSRSAVAMKRARAPPKEREAGNEARKSVLYRYNQRRGAGKRLEQI